MNGELTRRRLDDTPFQRGRILSRILRDEVRRQFERRGAGPVGRDTVEWTILYLRVQDGLSLQQIAARLQMPLRSVARYYARAKELLLDRLYTLNDEPTDAGIYCPMCGTRSDTALEACPTAFTCTGCSAELTLELAAEEALRLIARPAQRA